MHLIKLCVGVESVEHLAALEAARLDAARQAGQPAELIHHTRQTPRQRETLLAGGSLYWVIKGAVRVRQQIIDLREEADADGRSLCAIVLAPALVETTPQPRRAFQGWRYLKPEDAPADIGAVQGGEGDGIPAAMRAQLAELALL